MAQDLTIKQGKTFTLVIRAENKDVIVRKAISAISLASGAPRLTVTGHGLTNGWRAAVTRVGGMKQINAANYPWEDSDMQPVTVIDPNTVELNGVTPCDEQGNEWSAYTSGGFLEFYQPVDLTSKTARMKVRAKQDKTSQLLVSSDVADAPLNVLSLTVDNAAKTIVLTVKATDSDDFAWKTGYYDIELVGPTADDVLELANDKITVAKEVTA